MITDVDGVVDCEVHCEPPDLGVLVPYLSRYWKDRLGENKWPGPAGVAHCYPAPTSGEPIRTLNDLRASAPLAERDRLLLTCYYGIEMIRHPDFSRELAHAVNRWLHEEWLAEDSQLAGTLVVPIESPEAAAEEIRAWSTDDGFVQVLFPVVSQRAFGNRAYFPIYRAAEERGFVIGLHFGGVSGAPPTPSGWPDLYIEEAGAMTAVFQGQLLSLLAEGVFQEFPSLKFSLLESGVTWLPSLFWRLDKMWKSYRREIPWVKEAPSSYLRNAVRATLGPLDLPSDPRSGLEFIEQMGIEDLLMFATDRPHLHNWDATEMLDLLPSERRKRILADNARAWYDFR